MYLSLPGLVLLAAAATTAATKPPATGHHVTLDTSKGKIVIELYPDKAPKSVANFLAYVKAGHYDGTIFHRVIPNFMIQGGNLDTAHKPRATNAPIVNEADNGLLNDRLTLAMARTGDPNSATDQFFINVNNNTFLNFKSKDQANWGYAVFGKVISGAEVVDAIVSAPAHQTQYSEGEPVEAIVLKKATVTP